MKYKLKIVFKNKESLELLTNDKSIKKSKKGPILTIENYDINTAEILYIKYEELKDE